MLLFRKKQNKGGATPNSSGQSDREKCNENNRCCTVPYGERLQGIFKESGNDSDNRAEAGQSTILNVANCNPSGRGMNGSVYFCEGLAPTLTTNKGEGIKIITIEKRKEFDNEK